MYDPISVETALVSSGGDLLIQLSDGNVINAGRVRGNPGPKGDTGEQGVRGAHGKDGIDGTNGAKWHTGVGAPEIDLGVDGDLYMDVASALLPIWQKVNGDWLFLANLKPTPQFTPGGGDGGGGSVIIHPGPTPPTEDNNGRPIQDGDLWVDINGNILYVYYNGVWSEVTACGTGSLDEKKFVKRSGDSMYGDLLFKKDEDTDDADYLLSIRTNNTYDPRHRNFYGEYAEFKVDNALYFGPKTDTSAFNFEVWASRSNGRGGHYFQVAEDQLWSGSYNNANEFNSYMKHASSGNFMFRSEASGSGGFYVDVFGKGTHKDYISFYTDTSIRLNTDSGYILKLDDDDGLTYNATIEDTDDAKTVTNKEYVDTKDNILQQEIVNLQGEIESITPTVQAGIWQDGNSATPGTGHFAMRLGNGDITQDYTNTTIVTLIVSTTDKAGGVHTFEKEEVGDEIQLFDVEDQHYGLFKIDAIDTADPNYVQFTVTHLRGSGSTHVDDDVIIRTFKPVTSGDGSAYLLKNGEYVDPPAAVTFEWTKNVEFVTQNSTVSIENNWVDITSKNIQLLGKGGGKIFLQSEGKIELEAQTTLKLYSKTSDITLFADQNELVYRDIQDTDPPEQIVNKQYVDKLFDFSQYTELS